MVIVGLALLLVIVPDRVSGVAMLTLPLTFSVAPESTVSNPLLATVRAVVFWILAPAPSSRVPPLTFVAPL